MDTASSTNTTSSLGDVLANSAQNSVNNFQTSQQEVTTTNTTVYDTSHLDVASLPTQSLEASPITTPDVQVQDEYNYEEEDTSTDRKRTIIKIGLIVLIVALVCLAAFLLYNLVIKKLTGSSNSSSIASNTIQSQISSNESNSSLNNSQSVNSNSTSVATTTVRIWGMWESSQNMAPLISAFEKANPGVKIDYANREDISNTQAQYKQTLRDRFTGAPASIPDIFAIQNTWTDEMLPYLASSTNSGYTYNDYKNTFYQTFTDSFTRNGNVYAIPVGFDGLGVLYNKDLLAAQGYSKPAENWDNFKLQVIKLTKRDSSGNLITSGLSAGTFNNVSFAFDSLSLLMMQNGNLTDVNGNVVFGTDSGAKSAVDYYIKFATDVKSWDSQQQADIKSFADGRVAMMFAPLWRVNDLRKYYPSLNFDVAPAPQLTTSLANSTRIDFSNSWAYAVSKNANKDTQELAWKFLNFISQPEQLKTLYSKAQETRAVGQFYPRLDMINEMKGKPFTDAFATMAPTAQTWKMYDYEAVSEIFKKALNTNANSSALQSIASQVAALKK